MEFYAEAKFLGDANPGGFTAGLSMAESATAAEFEVCSETEGLTVFRDKRAHEIHQKRTKVGEAVCIETTFVNHNTEPVTLEMLATVALRGVRADKVHRLQSNWSAEGKLRTETVLDLHMEVSWNRCATRVEKFGTVGSMPVRKYFPFVALEDSETGEFTAIQLYCPASWQIELLRHFEEDRLSVVAGLADRDFGHWMKNVAPGESFTTPRAMLATGHSLYEVCDKLVKAQRPDISPVDDHMGILFNEYCTTWGNPTFENVKKICDKLEGRGIQYLVIDSGWYGKMDGWWNCIGDWDVNEEKFPGGMKPIADYIRSKGMIPGLWFELEPIGELSLFAKQFADSIAQTTGHIAMVTDRDQFIAVAGTSKKDLIGKPVSRELERLMSERENVVAARGDKGFIPIGTEEDDFEQQAIMPIISEGDVIGSVLILSREKKERLGIMELKIVGTAAAFLGRQMEQ